jgi:hypothetical protein
LFDNIEIKLICLLLAVVMWLYANKQDAIDRFRMAMSRDEQRKITLREVPISLVGWQKEWKADPSEIVLGVECPAAEIEMSNFRALVRLDQKDEEENRVTLTADNVVLPNGLVFVKAEPGELQLIPSSDDEGSTEVQNQ